MENLSIETVATSKNNKYDFKIALGSLIKFFYKEKLDFKDILIQSNKELDLKWKNQKMKAMVLHEMRFIY